MVKKTKILPIGEVVLISQDADYRDFLNHALDKKLIAIGEGDGEKFLVFANLNRGLDNAVTSLDNWVLTLFEHRKYTHWGK